MIRISLIDPGDMNRILFKNAPEIDIMHLQRHISNKAIYHIIHVLF